MRLFEDRVARLLVGRVPFDQVVEGPLGVEHHRPQLAVAGVDLDLLLLVAELGQAERVGQPLGRVDRQHDHLLAALGHARARPRPRWWSCPRRPSPRTRTICLRLSSCVDAHRRRSSSRDSVSTCSAPISGSNRKGRVVTGASASRFRRRSWLRCARARSCSDSAAASAARAAVRGLAVRGSDRLRLGAVEALGVDGVDHDRLDVLAHLLLQPITRGRASRSRACPRPAPRPPPRSGSGSARNSWMRPAWLATGPTRAASRKVLGARSIATPWPVAGASTITTS